MNVEGVAVERRRGRRVLSSMHAAFSFGGMTGAGLGGLAAAAGLDAEVHLAVVAGADAGRRGGGGHGAARAAPRRAEGPRRSCGPTARLALLGAVAFCVLLAEGSVTDWSAVYLNEGTGASEGLAAAGLAVFSLTMAIGRLAGDRTAERFSAPVGDPGGHAAGRGGPGAGAGRGRAGRGHRRLRAHGHRPVGVLPAGGGGVGARLGQRRGGLDRAGLGRGLRGPDGRAGHDRAAVRRGRAAPGAAAGGGAGRWWPRRWPAPPARDDSRSAS